MRLSALCLVAGRAPEERVFGGLALPLPTRRVMYSLRRQYARALYLYFDPGRRLPGPGKREISSPRDYDEAAARMIAAAVGRPSLDLETLVRWYIL
jgi:hypothetical protein